ncbi:hypothetical protein TNCT_538101 [Trichonephila clavata]|uniref:Uncharacterized protein n=1 Tax=Trichonephila clavata TaxID=2740835 RepID=A0A8X6H4Y0_TRICU|nr:hypothetical protein TNCT_538101 [Trichonephila clavata]
MPGYVDNMRGMMKNVRESVGPQVQEMSDSIVDSMPGYFDQAKGLLDAIPAPAKEYFGSMPGKHFIYFKHIFNFKKDGRLDSLIYFF